MAHRRRKCFLDKGWDSAMKSIVLLLFLASAIPRTETPTPPPLVDDETAGQHALNWITSYEERPASATRLCIVSRRGLTMAVFVINSPGGAYEAVQVGRSKYRDAYIRVDQGPPVRLQKGRLAFPAAATASLVSALLRGDRVYIEWTDPLYGPQQESASLDGFDEALHECRESMRGGQ